MTDREPSLLSTPGPDLVSSPDAETITVRCCKFDGSLHRTWQDRLVRRTDELIVLTGEFEFEVQHEWLGRIERGTKTLEYFWTGRWYSLIQFLNSAGEVSIQYINVNLPPTIQGSVLTYIDLDIDILLRLDGSYSILDEDEFQTNAQLFAYPAEIHTGVRATLTELAGLIKTNRFADIERL